eukprot:GEZU01017603.1.p1 GENE.GEZU01017603.1~~GEZU01017603.1.p1  ORF type:complete len:105 (+),score=21.90 GEZU01017603.1:325-639(+)
MTMITPIGVEVADSTVLDAIDGSRGQVPQSIVGATSNGIPRACPWAHVEREACLLEEPPMLVEWMVALVAPLESNQILWEFMNKLTKKAPTKGSTNSNQQAEHY